METKFESYLRELLQKRKDKLSREQHDELFIEQLGNNQIATKIIEKHGLDHPIALKSFDKFLIEQLLTAKERDISVFKKAHMKDSDEVG